MLTEKLLNDGTISARTVNDDTGGWVEYTKAFEIPGKGTLQFTTVTRDQGRPT